MEHGIGISLPEDIINITLAPVHRNMVHTLTVLLSIWEVEKNK